MFGLMIIVINKYNIIRLDNIYYDNHESHIKDKIQINVKYIQIKLNLFYQHINQIMKQILFQLYNVYLKLNDFNSREI
jgi:hypothetical protein